MLAVEGLHYRYPGNRALADVSFTLAAGSITALVGPNGAGKTTLLRCLAGLDEPYSGSIWLDDINVVEAPRSAHQRLGFLSDQFGLYAELTAQRCLQHAGASRGLRGKALSQRVTEVSEQVGLGDKLDALAASLSRGQRQRLALAQAIIHQPKVLLLDEPASGLDPEARSGLSSLMKSLAASGMTLVVSSHILAELEEYCTGMLVLQAGRLLEHRVLHDVSATSTLTPMRRWRIRFAASVDVSQLQPGLPPGWTLQPHGPTEFAVVSNSTDAEMSGQIGRLFALGLPVCEFTLIEHSLQEAYLATVREARA